jgi:hypothetical protein
LSKISEWMDVLNRRCLGSSQPFFFFIHFLPPSTCVFRIHPRNCFKRVYAADVMEILCSVSFLLYIRNGFSGYRREKKVATSDRGLATPQNPRTPWLESLQNPQNLIESSESHRISQNPVESHRIP